MSNVDFHHQDNSDLAAHASAPAVDLSNAEAIRRAHITLEGTLKAIALLYMPLGANCLAAPLFFWPIARDIGPAMLVAMFAFGALPLLAGIGLWRLKAWSRAVAATPAALLLLSGMSLPLVDGAVTVRGVVITIIAVVILTPLLSSKSTFILSPTYHEIVRLTPRVQYPIVVKAVFVVLAVCIALYAIFTFSTARVTFAD